MKFVAIFLACIVAAQAYYPGYNPGSQSGFGGAQPNYGATQQPSGFGGLTGYPSGLSGLSKPMGSQSGLMGGKSMGLMGGKSMGLMGGKSMGLMGGKSMGLMGGKSVGAQVSFACPSYQYWAQHQFHCLPPKQLYCYTVQFNRAWCTTQFYHDILVEYPKCFTEKTCEPEKENLEALLSEITSKLTAARQRIEIEMKSHSATFITRIDHVHAQWLHAFKLYISRCYNPDSYFYCHKVEAYQAELATAKKHALINIQTAVCANIAKIEAFHTQLIASFRSCLIKRLSALKEFSVKIEHSALLCVQHYQATLQSLVTKKVHFITSVFNKLYAHKDKPVQFAEFIGSLKMELEAKLSVDLEAFRKHVQVVLVQIKDAYRCNYKCLIRTGCYQFSKKAFIRNCVRLPHPPCPQLKLVGVDAFKLTWKPGHYKLKSASDSTKDELDVQVHLDAIEVKTTQFKAELAAKITRWRTQVITWEQRALASLLVTVDSIVPETYCDVAPDQAEIDAARLAASIRAKNWVAKNKKIILAQIEAVEKKVIAQIDAWKISAIKHIEQVKANFDACIASKQAKIDSFITILEHKKQLERAALIAKLNHCRSHHKAQFEKFFLCAFGTQEGEGLAAEIKSNYLECVDKHAEEVLAEFDAWWLKNQEKIVAHHACGLKCSAKIYCPSLRLHYSWTFCAPSINLCRLWC